MATSIIKLVSSFIGVLLLMVSCNAVEPKINVNSDGFAIKGYDTVAYFTLGKPVPGKKEFQHTWQDAKWIFSSNEHLQLFQQNPAQYIPQYGGY